mmetsp:Transcript_10350/g.18724  ORF Transcript_10350/g.18724 Transcript_10350/m.18724 type:complete len:1996 (+) Transcript_10350:67-6054(+)
MSIPMPHPNAPPPPAAENVPDPSNSSHGEDHHSSPLPTKSPLSPPSSYAPPQSSYKWLTKAKQSAEADQRKVWDIENQLKIDVTSLREAQQKRRREVLDSINASDRPLGLPMVQADEIESFSDLSLPPPPPNLSRIGEARPGQTLPPNPVIFLNFKGSIYTTTSKGSKGWVKSVIQIRNHHLIMNDDDGFNPNLEKRSERAQLKAKEGESKKKGRVYYMNKGGEATITGQPYEGAQNILVLKCVEQSKTKMLSFPSTTAMNAFQKAAEHVFSISPQDMGHRQAVKLLTTPITHYDHLTFPPHESNLPDPNMAKQATVCYATGYKFSMFGKSARCDCCGNGFAQDQVKPRQILHLPGEQPVPPASYHACTSCSTLLTTRELAAKAMEDALSRKDLAAVVKILNKDKVKVWDSTKPFAEEVEQPLVSPDYSHETGLTPLLIAVTLPDIELAKKEFANVLALDVDVNARAFTTSVKNVGGGSPKRGSAAQVRTRKLSSITINDRQISGVTPLMAAVMMEREEFVRLLLENGADPTVEGDATSKLSPLSFAAGGGGSLECLQIMCDAINNASICEETALKPDLNFRDGPDLQTALHNSALQNNADAAAALVAAGASRSSRSRNLEMPIHTASKRGSFRVVQVLLEGEGVAETLNGRDVDGMTPLLAAVNSFTSGEIDEEECIKVCQALLDSGAKVDVIDFFNQPPVEVLNAYIEDAEGEGEGMAIMETVDSLGFAIKSSRWDVVYRLIDNGNFSVDYLSSSSDFLTPLAAASCHPTPDEKNVRELISRGADPLSPCGSPSNEHAISLAALYGRFEVVKYLWGLTKQVEAEMIIGGMSPLGKAILGASGYDPEHDKEEGFMRNLSANEKLTALATVEFLLQVGSDPLHFADDGDTPFLSSIRGGDIRVVQKFINHSKASNPAAEDNTNAAPLFSLDSPHKNGMTALMLSAKLGKRDMCMSLVEAGASVQCRDGEGRDALHYACGNGETTTLKCLLGLSSSNTRAPDNYGFTLLHTAAKFLHSNPTNWDAAGQMFQMAFDAGVDFTLTEYTKGYTALDIVNLIPPNYEIPDRIPEILTSMDIAMHARDYKTILKHIELGNCPVDYLCATTGIATGVTALIVASSDSTGKGSVAELIELGADINHTSHVLVAPFEGASPAPITPLLGAVMVGNVAGAEVLLEKGARIGGVPVSGSGGSFILLAACQANREQLVHLLVGEGVDVSRKVEGLSCLFVASASGNSAIVQILREKGAVDEPLGAPAARLGLSKSEVNESYYGDKMTCLMAAAVQGEVEAMKELLKTTESGASDPAAKDSKGRISVHYAARSGNASAIRVLIGQSSLSDGSTPLDVNAVDNSGRTPLMDACISGNVEAVKCLLEAGADPSAEGRGPPPTRLSAGRRSSDASIRPTPLSCAIASNNNDVITAVNEALSKDDTAIVKGDLDTFIARVKRGAAPVNYEARRNVSQQNMMGSARKRADSILSGSDGPKVTALMKACELKNAGWVKELVELEADVNKGCDGEKPVIVCSRLNSIECMEELLKAGQRDPGNHRKAVNPNVATAKFETALGHAVFHDNAAMTRLLLSHGAYPMTECNNMELVGWTDSIEGTESTTPLYLAASAGKTDSLKEICKCMAYYANKARTENREVQGSYDVNMQTAQTCVTALMVASWAGHVECVRNLCKIAGANVTLQDRLGRTAAHLASMQGESDTMIVLCGEFGASCSVKDGAGNTVMDSAKDDLTRKIAQMGISGEGAYENYMNGVVSETNKRVLKVQEKLAKAQRDLQYAMERVADCEIDEDEEDVSVLYRFESLANIMMTETAMTEAKLRQLVNLKKLVKKVEVRVEEELEVRLNEATSLTTCMICKVNQRDCVLMPCRHLACCGECAQNPRFRTCPLCLARVENVAAEVTLHAPMATTVVAQGSLYDRTGNGMVDSQRGENGEEDVAYAPVVILRSSEEMIQQGSLMRGGDSTRTIGRESSGIITAEVEVAGGGGGGGNDDV